MDRPQLDQYIRTNYSIRRARNSKWENKQENNREKYSMQKSETDTLLVI